MNPNSSYNPNGSNTGKRFLMAFLDGIVFFVFLMGVIFLALSYSRAEKNKQKIQDMEVCTQETTATVTHLNIFNEKVNKDEIDSPTRDIYDADYTFTVDGQEYKGNYNSRKKIEMGDTFDIVYDPNDPNHSYLKEQIQKEISGDVKKMVFYYPGLVLVILGILAAIPLAVLQIIERKKEDKRREEAYQQALERHQAEMERLKYDKLNSQSTDEPRQ